MPTCYPQPSKQRSFDVLQAFASGCGGSLAERPALRSGPAVFYGVVGIETLFNQARARGDWYYGDNSFFDRGRGRFFRFARNAFQVSTLYAPDHARASAAGVRVRPWTMGGGHVVVAEQSAHFMRMSGAGEDWLERTAAELRRLTDRPIRMRPWRRDKQGAGHSLVADLSGAWALVTHMSAAATEAILSGVPAFVTGPCAATPMAAGALERIESPLRPDGREDWAAGLAGMQWTLEEMRHGMAWRALCG